MPSKKSEDGDEKKRGRDKKRREDKSKKRKRKRTVYSKSLKASKVDKAFLASDHSKKHPPKDENREQMRGHEMTVLWGEDAKKEFSRNLFNAMTPCRIFATIFGQFPVSYTKEANGSHTYKLSWGHFNTIYSILMLIIVTYTLFVGGWNFLMAVTGAFEFGSPSVLEREERWYERSLLNRHLMWVISFLAAILQTFWSMFYVFKNRYYFPDVLTFYGRVVRELHMDISDGVFLLLLGFIAVYLISTVGIVVLVVMKFTPTVIGTPMLFGIYMFRFYVIKQELWILETDSRLSLFILIVGSLWLILIFSASKVQMIFFMFHCRIMQNAFAVWNGRAYIVLMKGGNYFTTYEGKQTYELLYKDHCVLCDMHEAINRLSSGVMEMYYGLQTITVFLEVYFVIRSARYGVEVHEANADGGQFFIRPWDWLPGTLLVLQSLFFTLFSAKIAIDVGQEAAAGVEILRRKTMLKRVTDMELLFQMSMQASYNAVQKFEIYGAGYAYVNPDWILNYMNYIASYFIITYQFQPKLDRKTKGEWEIRENLGKFLEAFEGLPRNHYITTQTPTPVTYGRVNYSKVP